MLKFAELITSDGEEGVKKDASRWGRDVMIEERRRRRECVLDRTEGILDGGGGGVNIGLVGVPNFRPVGGDDTGGDGSVSVVGVV